MRSGPKLLVLDCNSLAYRAFFALPPLTTVEGTPTNAVYGFTTMLLRLLDEEKPNYVAAAFDKAPVRRIESFAQYKAHRPIAPSELKTQIPIVREILDAMRIPIFELEGYEADDIVGTIAKRAAGRGFKVLVVTGDKDALQLVSDKICAAITRKGVSEVKTYDKSAVWEEYGIEPHQIVDLKGLMGDQSDNIPGVPGIGEKTALKLIKEFGSVEGVLKRLEEVKPKRVSELLDQYADQALLSKQLATIDCDVPIEVDWEDCKRKEVQVDRLREIFRRLEFRSLLKRFEDASQTAKPAGISPAAKVELISATTVDIDIAGGIALDYQLSNHNPRRAQVRLALATGSHDAFCCENIEEIRKFSRILEDESVPKYGHDLKPLVVALKSNGINVRGVEFDSAIAAYLLDPSRSSYRLEDLSRAFLGEDVPALEDFQKPGLRRPAEIAACLGRRASVIKHLRPAMYRELQDKELVRLFEEVEVPLISVLADMEINGIKVDLNELEKIFNELVVSIDKIVGEIYEMAGMEFNINSTRQLADVLYGKLGLPALKKTKTGYSTNAEVLEELAPAHEIVRKVLTYRQLVKLKGTYVDGLKAQLDKESQKVYSTFNQTVTATGRISSAEPNLQNIPIRFEQGRKIRKVFVPSEPGWLFLSGDYSQIELRVLAHISGDEVLIKAFHEDQDIHVFTASEVFGVPANEVTPEMRARAKAVNFGIVYGMSDYGLAKDIGISRKEAANYIENYFKRYVKVREYVESTVRQARLTGYVTTLMNRRRYLPDIASRNKTARAFAERTAMNTPIQGTAADIIKLAMVRIHRKLYENNMRSRLLLQVHDELLFEAPENEVEALKEIVVREMEGAVTLRVPLKVDIKLGTNWYDMAKV